MNDSHEEQPSRRILTGDKDEDFQFSSQYSDRNKKNSSSQQADSFKTQLHQNSMYQSQRGLMLESSFNKTKNPYQPEKLSNKQKKNRHSNFHSWTQGSDDTDNPTFKGQGSLFEQRDVIQDQLQLLITFVKSQRLFLLLSSLILAIFSATHLIYQLYLLITIQRQVQIIGDAPDDEGNQINLETSYTLYICGIVFGVCIDSLGMGFGILGSKIFYKQRESVVRLIQEGFQTSKHSKLRITKQYSSAFIIGAFAMILLMIIQIGINFINIQQAQSQYTKDHRMQHQKLGVTLSLEEREALTSLRTAYQSSYIAFAVVYIIFLVFYSLKLSKYQKNLLKIDNISKTIANINTYKQAKSSKDDVLALELTDLNSGRKQYSNLKQ